MTQYAIPQMGRLEQQLYDDDDEKELGKLKDAKARVQVKELLIPPQQLFHLYFPGTFSF